jgi:NAD(P)H-hydrate epimerase
VAVLAGKGNNGGGGLVTATYLHNKGIYIEVVLADNNLKEASAHQLVALKAMGVKINNRIKSKPELIVDALLGYNAKGQPKGKIAELIQ